MEQYGAIATAVILFIVSIGIFTTPKQLSDTKDKIYDDIDRKLKEQEEKFATKEIVNSLKQDFEEVKKKIDKIYDLLLQKQ
jgi:hypothetical protein